MRNLSDGQLKVFENLIGMRFQLYNSLFTALPFYRVEKTGTLLSLFLLHCEETYNKGGSPIEAVRGFLNQYTNYETDQEKVDLLFRFVQYAERQVVLFDALEDSAFPRVNDMQGQGTLKHLLSQVTEADKKEEFQEKLKNYAVRLVLTAHPTQFYPGEVLGIINDLSQDLLKDDPASVNMLLRQLGKTPFLKHEKPTPLDEAISLIWYLENVFYPAAGAIVDEVNNQYLGNSDEIFKIIRMGFWPGGDRDGNPFVNAETTLKVADRLRTAILKCYYLDVRALKRRLTFKGVESLVSELENKIYNNLVIPGHELDITKDEILRKLREIREVIRLRHGDLFIGLVEELIGKVELFGLFFASLDIRQDSSVHKPLIQYIAENTDGLPSNYDTLNEEEKLDALAKAEGDLDFSEWENERFRDVFEVIHTVKEIQEANGEEGCHRYIISHSTGPLDLMEIFALFKLGGWKEEDLTLDIIPLFESVEDLQNASEVMGRLYRLPAYRKHLERRGGVQTIMLGFSDGTKDGGYLMANWSIFEAKKQLTAISREYEVEVVFFDGRGGPPARGGGKTHRFFASMGKEVSSREIQLTIQGQTVSSNFGTVESARFNLEQLVHAGISTDLFDNPKRALSESEKELFKNLAQESYDAFQILKNDPLFLQYLNYASPLKYYAKTNIGSRPSKRSKSELSLDSLRAVPYVGSWSQLKQNVPGFYGLGSALEKLHDQGQWEELQELYKNSLFFKALLDNCEMSMKKCFFPLTAYLADHPEYGYIWKMIKGEYDKTEKFLLKLSGHTQLMEEYAVDRSSIQMRERIILPLITIQQFALTHVREGTEMSDEMREAFENLVVRCSFGIINAGRNSA